MEKPLIFVYIKEGYMKKVSLVIPMYYEEEVAEECYERVKKNLIELKDFDYEIIFVIKH